MIRSRIAAAAVRFAGAAEGNVAIIFALAAIPMLIAAGGATDFAIASRIQTQLYAICRLRRSRGDDAGDDVAERGRRENGRHRHVRGAGRADQAPHL